MKKHPILFSILIFFGLCSFILFAFTTFLFTPGSHSFSSSPIVIVKIEGAIFDSLKILKELEEIRKDSRIKAVVLRLDSPGGAVAPSQEIMEQVLKLKKDKKVIVSMGTVAASGAYYIACAANKIVASSGTVTGSIGVILESFGLKELMERLSIESRVIKSGQYKDVGNPFKELTESDRSYLQNIIDDMYEQFLKSVSENRNIPLEQVRRIAEGKIYTGLQAKELGLVDELGNVYAAIDLAKKEAGLPEDADVSWPAEPSKWERFFSGESASVFFDFFSNKLRLPLWLLNT